MRSNVTNYDYKLQTHDIHFMCTLHSTKKKIKHELLSGCQFIIRNIGEFWFVTFYIQICNAAVQSESFQQKKHNKTKNETLLNTKQNLGLRCQYILKAF